MSTREEIYRLIPRNLEITRSQTYYRNEHWDKKFNEWTEMKNNIKLILKETIK